MILDISLTNLFLGTSPKLQDLVSQEAIKKNQIVEHPIKLRFVKNPNTETSISTDGKHCIIDHSLLNRTCRQRR